ncbi:MAG: peptidyl-alpha-hydroxyglycine alpha-amidating lyase family protein [SAR202 cluster bacterium]|nr:peptidyl-alpha-hydroxyglycine alpha-amidating lyase family protein [SAR202 cluster bacterium]
MTYEIGYRKYEVDERWGRMPEGYEIFRAAGVAVDGDDRVYVFNRSANNVIVFDREGDMITAWDRDFIEPHAATVDQHGNIYLVDRDTHVIEKFTLDGELLMTLGNRNQPSDTGGTELGQLANKAGGPNNKPTGVAVAADGTIFVSDGYQNCRVHKYDAEGNHLMSWGVPGKVEPGHFHLPHGIGVDNRGRVLVCDRENHRIQLFNQDGEHLETWTGFRQPTAVVIGPDDTVYVPELQARVTILDSDGKVLGQWGGEEDQAPGGFVAPHGIAIDSHGDIYVGEVLEGARIQKFVLQ